MNKTTALGLQFGTHISQSRKAWAQVAWGIILVYCGRPNPYHNPYDDKMVLEPQQYHQIESWLTENNTTKLIV